MGTGLNNAVRKLKPLANTGFVTAFSKGPTKRLAPVDPEHALTLEEVHQQIKDNTGMIWAVVLRWWKINKEQVDKEDLFNESISGWMYAARYFDRRRPLKFSTYATWWAQSRIRNFLQSELNQGFRVPGSYHKKMTRLPRPVSLNLDYRRLGGSGIGHTIPARREHFKEETPEFPEDFWDRVNKFLEPKEIKIIALRYRQGKTLEEIAKDMKLTRERCRQIEWRALDKIGRRCEFGDYLGELS